MGLPVESASWKIWWHFEQSALVAARFPASRSKSGFWALFSMISARSSSFRVKPSYNSCASPSRRFDIQGTRYRNFSANCPIWCSFRRGMDLPSRPKVSVSRPRSAMVFSRSLITSLTDSGSKSKEEETDCQVVEISHSPYLTENILEICTDRPLFAAEFMRSYITVFGPMRQ